VIFEFLELGGRALLANEIVSDRQIRRSWPPIVGQAVSADGLLALPSLFLNFLVLFFLRERGAFGRLRISAEIRKFPQIFSLDLFA